MNKGHRQMKIREFIGNNTVRNQEEILNYLLSFDLHVTQATVSRDIKEMLISKISLPDGTYKYSLPVDNRINPTVRLHRVLNDILISADIAENIVVLKTLPGNAGALGTLIDGVDNGKVVGSICGDDTIFILCRTTELAEEFKNYIMGLLD